MSTPAGAPVINSAPAHAGDDPAAVGQLLLAAPSGQPTTTPQPSQDAGSLWTAGLAALNEAGTTHRAWLAQVRPLAIVDDTLVVAVADEFVKDWLQQRYLPTLVDAIAGTAGRRLRVELTVQQPSGDAGHAGEHGDAGHEPQAAEEAAARARADAARRLEGRWQAACPRKFWGTRLDNVPVTDEVRAQAARYARHLAGATAGNLLITGSKGVAKTGLALAIGRAGVEAGLSLRFTPAYDLLLELRGSYSAAIRAYTEPDVLILEFDELLRDPNDWQAEQFFALVNRRDLDAKPIIITTNRPPYDVRLQDGTVVVGLASLLSPATWDRLQDSAEIITIVGPSLRRPKPRLQPVDGNPATPRTDGGEQGRGP